MGFETPKMADDNNKEKIRESGLTEEESAEYKILWDSKRASGGEEFELSPEEENRIRELEEKMQKFQDQDKKDKEDTDITEIIKNAKKETGVKFDKSYEIITDEDEK